MSHSKRKRFNRLNVSSVKGIHYLDPELGNLVTETGQIGPQRVTGLPGKVQRELARTVKLARFLALLPYCDKHIG